MTPCESYPQKFAKTKLLATIVAFSAGTPPASSKLRAKSRNLVSENTGTLSLPYGSPCDVKSEAIRV